MTELSFDSQSYRCPNKRPTVTDQPRSYEADHTAMLLENWTGWLKHTLAVSAVTQFFVVMYHKVVYSHSLGMVSYLNSTALKDKCRKLSVRNCEDCNSFKDYTKNKISPVGDWRSTSLEWRFSILDRWIESDIPSSITHQSLPT